LRLVSAFGASGPLYEALRRVDLPMTVELADFGEFEVSEEPRLARAFDTSAGTRDLRIVGARTVDPGRLIKVDDIFSRTGIGPGVLDTIDGDVGLLVEGVDFIVGAISFLTGVPMQVMTSFGEGFRNELIPETEDDAKRLREFGTRFARISVGALNVVETIGRVEVDGPLIAALASRRIASVYADALGDLSPSVRFFSLWRTLEFAFQATGKDLVLLLLNFPKVSTMEFDRAELEELRAVRGRLGHAVSRSGYGEVLEANSLALRQLGRLWCLVDWVVSSKTGPGRDTDCEPLAELTAFIDRDGITKIVDPKVDPTEWIESWSHHSHRFNP
jgi:hypothetical protein